MNDISSGAPVVSVLSDRDRYGASSVRRRDDERDI
jgi:hypothetical protein